MYKDFVMPSTGAPGDEQALDMAIAMTARAQGHLSVLVPVNLPTLMVGQWGALPDTVIAEIYDQLRSQADAQAERVRNRLGRETISSEVRMLESVATEPSLTVAMQARHADLSVLTGPGGREDAGGSISIYFGKLLMESGRPLLVVPPHHDVEATARRVMVAWQPTREATRALHDALPLMQHADVVEVVAIESEPGERGHGGEPCADIAAHLARHGLEVNVQVRRRRSSETVSTALLRLAADSGAQLLVAGGYGHSRLREWALGGTTLELLEAAHLPVLFSH